MIVGNRWDRPRKEGESYSLKESRK